MTGGNHRGNIFTYETLVHAISGAAVSDTNFINYKK